MLLRPKNWHDFQHYKDRDPTWIKLHKKLLDDFEFQMLPVASRALAPMLWLLASESKDGVIDADNRKLAFRLRMSPDEVGNAIKPLIEVGFFTVYRSDSDPLATAERADSLEKKEESREQVQVQVQQQVQTEFNAPQAVASSKPRAAPRKSLPENFPLKPDLDWALELWLKKGRVDLCEGVSDEVEKFRDHHVGKSTMSASWPGSWRTWCRLAMSFNSIPRTSSSFPTATIHKVA